MINNTTFRSTQEEWSTIVSNLSQLIIKHHSSGIFSFNNS